MNLTELKDKLSGALRGGTQTLRQKIFGVNNEHIDFVMDSFYKLDAPQRNTVVGLIVGAISAMVVAGFSLYYVQVGSLDRELDEVFVALHKVRDLKADADKAQDRYDKLVQVVRSKTGDINFKSYFEKISERLNLEIKTIREKPVEADPNDALASRISQVHIDVNLVKVSIPKLLNFLVEVEKDGHLVRIQNLKITGIYGNKLFFDVETIFRGYHVNS